MSILTVNHLFIDNQLQFVHLSFNSQYQVSIHVLFVMFIANFRSEYEIEYEYNFSNLVPTLSIIKFHTSLVPIVFFSTDK